MINTETNERCVAWCDESLRVFETKRIALGQPPFYNAQHLSTGYGVRGFTIHTLDDEIIENSPERMVSALLKIVTG